MIKQKQNKTKKTKWQIIIKNNNNNDNNNNQKNNKKMKRRRISSTGTGHFISGRLLKGVQLATYKEQEEEREGP